jgi:hypothetical protein
VLGAWKEGGHRISATRTAARAGRILAYVLIGLDIAAFALAASLGGAVVRLSRLVPVGSGPSGGDSEASARSPAGVRVEDVMSRDPSPCREKRVFPSSSTPYALRHRFSTFPVLLRSGEPVGLA